MERDRRPGGTEDGAQQTTSGQGFWSHARAGLDGLPGNQGLNIAHEAVDRHAEGANADGIALKCVANDGSCRDITYRELRALTNQFANVLQRNGIEGGDCLATLLGRTPELYIAALGTLKNRSVLCPLFSAFGPEPILVRMRKSAARVLVTTETLYERKIKPIRGALPKLDTVLVLRDGGTGAGPANTLDFHAQLHSASDDFTLPATSPDDLALLHFTSGTTGTPKGAMHVHEAVVAHHATAAAALDLRREDVFWCTADPGWVTGTSYGIIAPLTHGTTLVVDEGEFDAHRWYRTLDDLDVTVWYTAPTAIRMLMRAGNDALGARRPDKLRFIASVGEALSPDAVHWSMDLFGQPIHDNWWQTETGCIMVGNCADTVVKPGSMGKPLPGVEACLVERERGGHVAMVDAAGAVGELAFKAGWPSMFRGYIDEEARYRACFSDGWYLSGDLARRDDDGYYWFVGRVDDVIKSSGLNSSPGSTLLKTKSLKTPK